MNRVGAVFATFLYWLLQPAFASACSDPYGSVHLASFLKADLIFAAKVASYRYDPQNHVGYFDLIVVNRLRGTKINPGILLKGIGWRTYPFRETFSKTNVIVGVRVSLDPEGRSRLNLVQDACSPDYLLDDTPDNRIMMQNDLDLISMQLSLEGRKWEHGVTDIRRKSLDQEIERIQAIRCKLRSC